MKIEIDKDKKTIYFEPDEPIIDILWLVKEEFNLDETWTFGVKDDSSEIKYTYTRT